MMTGKIAQVNHPTQERRRREMLRKACLSLAIVAASLFAGREASAQEFVSGHYRHNTNGSYSYVRPHYRTHADTSFYNNWSTHPNVNPYTGRVGTHHRPSYGYGSSYGGGLGTGVSNRSGSSWFGW
jgi:hypothetical protein